VNLVLSGQKVLILNEQCGKNPANNHTSQAASQHPQLSASIDFNPANNHTSQAASQHSQLSAKFS